MLEGGKAFLEQVGAVPILMIQVHCLEIKIAVLDMPYCVYYQVRVLESFTIPLKLLENPEELEKFVNCWLRLQAYINKVARELRHLWQMKRELFFSQRDTDLNAMNIDHLET